MQGDNPISWLMFFTLAATVFIIAGGLISFLRSSRNRDIAATALEGNNSRVGATPNGAGIELIGFAGIAVAVMALLVGGYHSKTSAETAQMTTPVGGVTTGMAQKPGLADQPKQYQPANPTADMRAAPTQSDTGWKSENGSTGQPK